MHGGVGAGRTEAVASATGLAEGLTGDTAAVEGALKQMPSGSRELLRVHVSVAIDEARRHHATLGINHLLSARADPTDRDDAAVLHTDVGAIAGRGQSRR